METPIATDIQEGDNSGRFWSGRNQAVVFDSDPDTCELLSYELRMAGLDAFVATSLEQFAEIVARRRIDFVVAERNLEALEEIMDCEACLEGGHLDILSFEVILNSMRKEGVAGLGRYLHYEC